MIAYRLRILAAALAVAGVGVGVWHVERAFDGLTIERGWVETTPYSIYRHADTGDGPAVFIAHGFAGSETIMEPFATTLAHAGYTAVTFDYLGHGRNRAPLTGDVTKETGATQALLDQMSEVAAALDVLIPGHAVLGHSMASDIIVRYAAPGDVPATVAVSMFSPAVTAGTPPNLLTIVGAWEPGLIAEALRVTALRAPGEKAEPGVLYGDVRDGTARMTVIADHVEHVGVLYSEDSLTAARDWLNAVYGRDGTGFVDTRGGWIVLIMAGVIALAWPLAALLPRVQPPAPDGPPRLTRRWAVIAVIGPALGTPLLLWPAPLDVLPMAVGGYLAAHFAVYGALTAVSLVVGTPRGWRPFRVPVPAFTVAAVFATAYGVGAFAWPLDRYFTNYVPGPERFWLIAALAVGTAAYFFADAWLRTHFARPIVFGLLAKGALLLSLGVAVALNFAELFFLLLILPLILIFFALYGLLAHWVTRKTGTPTVAAAAKAVAFAWAIAVTFPLLAD